MEVAAVVTATIAAGACGSQSAPEPDRDQVARTVKQFVTAAAADDIETICGALTPVGRGQAVGLGRTRGRRPRRVSLRSCVARGARVVTSGRAELEAHAPRIQRVEISGSTARAVLANGALRRTQRLKASPRGWKIDQFDLAFGG